MRQRDTTRELNMQAQLYQAICHLRGLIHEAEPPYTKPHEYMNVDRPLTPLRYECVEGTVAPRMLALRHALFLLQQAEMQLRGAEKTSEERQQTTHLSVTSTIGCVGGILWLYGIDSSHVGEMPKAA